jgi:BlaI family transcriptional regulator, penicillinase repressor
MASTRLTKLELQIMETFWRRGACSVREVQEAFPEPGRPAYTTVQTTVYRLERKKALRLAKRISNANIFEAAISRDEAQRRLIDELLVLLGGRGKLVMARLVESGSLSMEDLKEAERELRRLARKEKTQ